MDGILNIRKEKGFTSHDVVAVVRRILHTKTVGHTGTLDPDAEGVLPVCVGKATKLADIIMDGKKRSRGMGRLGLTPPTEDAAGEVLEEREAGKHFEVVDAQIKGSLFDLSAEDFAKIVLAYEPVWAIGTGKTATSDQAEEIHAHIRATLAAKYGQEIADNCTILYGGSCNASNAKELFAKPNVDGGLIGGASLAVDKFMPIIEAFN